MRRASFPIAVLAVVGALAGCGGGGEGGADTAAPTGAGSVTSGTLMVGRDAFLVGTEPRCGDCHTLADAGTTSRIASNLDEVKPTFDQVIAAMNDGPGAMPEFDDVNPGVKESIAAYVEFATHQDG